MNVITRHNNNSEKQISVDPISLRPQENRRNNPYDDPPPSTPPPPKSKFLSFSATSSPCHLGKPKPPPPRAHRQNLVALANLERLRQSRTMRRSKSCGEGRSYQPSIDFDIISSSSSSSYNNIRKNHKQSATAVSTACPSGAGLGKEEKEDEEFKCGALCLFIPGFGKGRASVVKARKEADNSLDMAGWQRASLEKFECGSWRSSNGGDARNNQSLFFDLPSELIRCSTANDTESPVTAAFVFDGGSKGQEEQKGGGDVTTITPLGLKGVLKHYDSSTYGRSEGSSSTRRHVRFSVSSSSPTTPRARDDDFSAFLEAQNSLQ